MGQLQNLISRLKTSLLVRASALRGRVPMPDFFDKEEDFDEVIKLFKRDSYVEALKGLDSGPHKMNKWVAAKSPAEFIAGLERDTRARTRSRLDHYRAAILTKQTTPMFHERYRTAVETLEA
jgi:hypothetical protein